MDRKTLLTLNGGGSWGRNFKSYSGYMERTAFNITGFIQPSYVHEMLTDADGLNDRELFDFPPKRELMLEELKVPMPDDTPSLEKMFSQIMENHQERKVYTLDGESYSEYQMIHDNLVQDEWFVGIMHL